MIFIGKNHNGKVISIVSARSEESANAYWQGKDCLPYSVIKFDLEKDRDNEKLGYVTPILVTEEISASRFGGNPQLFIVIK